MRKKALFQQIDESLFKLIDQLKTQVAYQKFQDAIGKLGEQQQKYINLALSYLLVSLPAILLLVVWMMNSNLRSNIEKKEEILSEIQRFNDRRAISDSKGKALIVPSPIAAQSELQSKVSQILGRINIPTTSVSVRSMTEGEMAGSLREFNAELTFDKLSTKQFNDLIKELEQRERIRISNFLIENKIDQSILKGRMSLAFLTQSSQ